VEKLTHKEIAMVSGGYGYYYPNWGQGDLSRLGYIYGNAGYVSENGDWLVAGGYVIWGNNAGCSGAPAPGGAIASVINAISAGIKSGAIVL